MKQENADKYFFKIAQVVSSQSKDPSTKTGCVVIGPDCEVRSMGYNGFPRGVQDTDCPERYERPIKYKWTEHCERNAIYNAARMGISLLGCTMYLTWFPCADCARAIIQSGITYLVVPKEGIERGRDRWGEDFDVAKQMLNEADIKIRLVDTECCCDEEEG